MKNIVLLTLLLVSFNTAYATQNTDHRARSLELFRELIGFRTAAGHEQVLPMARLLEQRFLAGGFAAEQVQVLPMKDTAALVVRYPGIADSGKRPIMLMAHMDVVDALPKDWVRDPFTLIEEEGYYYGRGTIDNKAGVVNLTTVFLRLKEEDYTPDRDLIIVFSGDEETTGYTMNTLLSDHRDLVDAEYALNSDGGGGVRDVDGKPISFNMQTAEKTYMTFTLTATNPGGHSSRPRADNAIYELAAALGKIADLRFPVRSNDTTRLYFRRSAELHSGELAAAMRAFADNPDDQAASDYLASQPSFNGLTRTTCVATLLDAGHAENALPQSATATVNCRVWPDESSASVQKALENAVDNSDIRVQLVDGYSSSPPSPLRDDLLAAIEQVLAQQHPATPIIPYMAPYFTDGKYTRGAGIPTYGVGGVFLGPDDHRAHGLDERIPVMSFYESQDFWYQLLKLLTGGDD